MRCRLRFADDRIHFVGNGLRCRWTLFRLEANQKTGDGRESPLVRREANIGPDQQIVAVRVDVVDGVAAQRHQLTIAVDRIAEKVDFRQIGNIAHHGGGESRYLIVGQIQLFQVRRIGEQPLVPTADPIFGQIDADQIDGARKRIAITERDNLIFAKAQFAQKRSSGKDSLLIGERQFRMVQVEVFETGQAGQRRPAEILFAESVAVQVELDE